MEQLCEDLLARIREEIIPIFERAITDEVVEFKNTHLVNCWKKKNCKWSDCPCMDKEKLRCWQIAGTYCGGQVQGFFTEKYDNCRECEVFRSACPTIVEELGENLNNMLFLLRKQKTSLAQKAEKINYLNKELLSSLEALDARNKEIQELVITDKLTGLYNRHYMLTILEDELFRCSRKGYSFSIMMIDIDDFKSFNDTHGHMAGDELLAFFGKLLKSIIRKYDRAFRYGGEEFMVILPETNLTLAWVIAERIRERFAEKKFRVRNDDSEAGGQDSRTLSIGCACYYDGITASKLLEMADDAMYAAKSQGKNMVVRFDELQ